MKQQKTKQKKKDLNVMYLKFIISKFIFVLFSNNNNLTLGHRSTP